VVAVSLKKKRLQGAPRSARIINRAMELYLSGDVTLVRNIDGMDLRGALTIDSGRLPVFNNDFTVDRGDRPLRRSGRIDARALAQQVPEH